MPNATIRVVDVYPYRQQGEGPEFLLMKRASSAIYAGQWRMIGGKIESGETAWETALREVKEETGQIPVRLWSVPSMNHFYEWKHDRINLIPAFAAELDADPVLNHEHTDVAWTSVDAAADRLQWPEQQRLLRMTHRLLLHGIPPELEIEC